MGHITAELTKGWMMEGIGMQVVGSLGDMDVILGKDVL